MCPGVDTGYYYGCKRWRFILKINSSLGMGRPNSLPSNPKDSPDDIAERLRLALGYFTG